MSNIKHSNVKLPKSVQGMSKEMLAETIKKKRECNKKALDIVKYMLEGALTEKDFLSCLVHINQSHFQDIVEERSVVNLCGYPICSKTLGKVSTQKYHISTKSNKVYDITERKLFCSNNCYKGAKYIKEQLLTSPLWLRDVEKIPNFKLLTVFMDSCGRGEEVDIRINAKEEVDNLKSKLEDSLLVSDNDLCTDFEVGDSCPSSEPSNTWPSKTICEDVHLKSLSENNIDSTKSNDSEKTFKDYEKEQIIENKQDLQNVKREVGEKEKKIGKKLEQQYILRKTKEKEKQPTNISGSSVIQHLEKTIFEWCTIHTLIYVYGKEKVKTLVDTKSDEKGASESINVESRKKYFEVCKKLNLTEFEDNVKALEPLPNYSLLKKEGEKLQVKVRAFYQGVLDCGDEPVEEINDNTQESNFLMPVVDSNAQNVLRRKIVIDRLNNVIPNVLRILNSPLLIEKCEIRSLVHHFNLQAFNITFKPAAWNLLGLIIIKMLSIRNKELDSHLKEKEFQKQIALLLKQYGLDVSYLDRFFEKLVEKTFLMEELAN